MCFFLFFADFITFAVILEAKLLRPLRKALLVGLPTS